MIKNYYSSTAYDSTNKRTLALFNRSNMKLGERTIRNHPMSIEAAQCREYLGKSAGFGFVMQLRHISESKFQEMYALNLHEYFQWHTSHNKAASVESIVSVAAYFWIVGLIPLVIIGFMIGFGFVWLVVAGINVLLPFTIWTIGKIALKRGWVKHGNNVMFNRRTGMITLPWQGEMFSLPFDEFDAFTSASMTVVATTNMFLRLAHRYSDKSIVCPMSFSHSWRLNAEWEEIQHFMDISKPLPDTPNYDFARVNDPVSAAYDKKNNRPKDYWRKYDLSHLREMIDASLKAGGNFPWGKTRKQALQSGWTPSGFGEGEWRELKQETYCGLMILDILLRV